MRRASLAALLGVAFLSVNAAADENFSFTATTDKPEYASRDVITVYVACENNTDREIDIEGRRVSQGNRFATIEYVAYGRDEVKTWDGQLVGHLGKSGRGSSPFGGDVFFGPWSDFGVEFDKFAPYLFLHQSSPPVTDIRIPARSRVIFAMTKFRAVEVSGARKPLRPGSYVLLLGFNTVHTSLGTFQDIQFSAPLEIHNRGGGRP